MHRDSTKTSGTAALKSLMADGLYRSGMLRAFHAFTRSYEIAASGAETGRLRKVQKAKYLVLGYHRVGTEGAPFYSTLPRAAFAAQMRYIKRNYRIISVSQMAKELGDPDVQGRAVVVTFDDGYGDIFSEAFPILRDYGIPATIYLTGQAIETGELPWYDRIFLRLQHAENILNVTLDKPHTFQLDSKAVRLVAAEKIVTYLRSIPDDERRAWCANFEKQVPVPRHTLRGSMLTWDEIREMHRAGITFGAHTMTHPVVSRLLPEALRDEVSQSKRLVEQRLDTAVNEFAYPFGKVRDCGTAAASTLKQLGFLTALTTIVGINEPGSSLLRLRRLVVNNDASISRFALQLQRLFFHPVDEELSAVV